MAHLRAWHPDQVEVLRNTKVDLNDKIQNSFSLEVVDDGKEKEF